MKAGGKGYTLIELLVVLTIFSFLSILGFKLLATQLHYQRVNIDWQVEKESLHSLVRSLQQSFDNRYLNPFSSKPWLIIEKESGEGWCRLQNLEIAVILDGKVKTWKWEAPGRYPVLIKTDRNAYLSDQSPEMFLVKFPKSRMTEFRSGIAIEGF